MNDTLNYTNWGFGRLSRRVRFAASCARIIPTGDLEGCQDYHKFAEILVIIIPTGDLEGCQDIIAEGSGDLPIIPTGDLEGCQDGMNMYYNPNEIIPTGDLEGCQDDWEKTMSDYPIIPTGDLEGCQDASVGEECGTHYYTNWGFGRLLAQPELPFLYSRPRLASCQPSTCPAANR